MDKRETIKNAFYLMIAERHPTDAEKSVAIITDAILGLGEFGGAPAKPPSSKILLVFDEYCRNNDNTLSCSYLNMEKPFCYKYQVTISQISSGGTYSPVYFSRCDACKDPKTGYPNGLVLIGRK